MFLENGEEKEDNGGNADVNEEEMERRRVERGGDQETDNAGQEPDAEKEHRVSEK